ncbi:MAG: phospho-sugar mutase [Parachlamydiaceae bacterium]|nr:phospho-sugar mutase [Parachlamydiaceae bacterium]
MKLEESITLDPITKKNVDLWLNGQYDEETKASIRQMLKEDPKKVLDAFFTNLTFGTAGLRGIMGVGTNRMNIYTVGAATQGLSNYILKQSDKNKLNSVFIGYDSRNNSRAFAEETAKVLAGNGIQVYLCNDIRPTPFISFGCRYKKCIAAIMITASHNPAEYNGYKVYWTDGGQIVPPHDTGIIAEVSKITDPSMIKKASSLSNSLIKQVDPDVDEAYLKAVGALQHYPDANREKGKDLKIVYTSLHGTGITLMPKTLALWGFTTLSFVEKQIIPDGNFPTVKSPNPEEKPALQMGIDLMLKNNSDILIANDPDADRVGVAINQGGEAVILNGNQILAICLEHVCEALSKVNKLPKKAAFIKTISATELFQAICDTYQRPCFNVLTGFKYIAEKIHEWEQLPDGYQFVFGGEDSYGYLSGTYARDKDALSTGALICEAALQAKLQGKTLLDRLYDLYRKYGLYEEKIISVNFGDTKEGKEKMSTGMDRLRHSGLKEINGIPVVAIEDYETSTKQYLQTNKVEAITLPVSNVLLYWLKDGSKVMIRPSGTEPKVKIYCGVVEKKFTSITAGLEACNKRCDAILEFLKNHLLAEI